MTGKLIHWNWHTLFPRYKCHIKAITLLVPSQLSLQYPSHLPCHLARACCSGTCTNSLQNPLERRGDYQVPFAGPVSKLLFNVAHRILNSTGSMPEFQVLCLNKIQLNFFLCDSHLVSFRVSIPCTCPGSSPKSAKSGQVLSSPPCSHPFIWQRPRATLSACLSFRNSEIVLLGIADGSCSSALNSLACGTVAWVFDPSRSCTIKTQRLTQSAFSWQLRSSASSMANSRSLRSLFKTITLLAAIFLLVLGFGFTRYSDRVLRTQPISTGNLDSPSEGQHSFALVP
jgi:hypothetical protein